jgi:hypothetical protein
MRISTSQGNNFVEIYGMDNEIGLMVDFFPTFHYIEIREKNGSMKTFLFNKKSMKKEHDFGWWADAEVVFSRNNVVHS